MQALKDKDTTSEQRSLEQVASYRHTVGLLAILCAVFAIARIELLQHISK